MQIPLVYRERMAAAGTGPAARAEGIAIAREALSGVREQVAGAYIMPPFNRVDSAIEISTSSAAVAGTLNPPY